MFFTNSNPMFFSILVVAIMSSCGKRFYTPNSNPVPLFKNKGDVFINATTNFTNKVDATLGYAIIDGFGAYASAARSKEKYTLKEYNSSNSMPYYITNKHNGSLLNFGAGYFLPEKISEEFRFEIFGDLAIGKYYNTYDYAPAGYGLHTLSFLTGNFQRIGILSNIGYTSYDNFFSIAYTCRLSNLRFSNYSTDNPTIWKEEIDKLNSRSSYNLLEHGINFNIGRDLVKFQNQIGFYHGLNSQGENISAIQSLNISYILGLIVKLNAFGIE